tara:strand:+ start:932 stop:1258 length:327 start_codon:yes stop_codon:yes gene_type:complete
MVGWYFFDYRLVSNICLSMAVLFLVVTISKSELLLPLNKGWMMLGFLISIIVSPIVLGVLFYGLFVPTAIMMRIVGRDELRLKIKLRKSHWKYKQSVGSQKESFRNQF